MAGKRIHLEVTLSRIEKQKRYREKRKAELETLKTTACAETFRDLSSM